MLHEDISWELLTETSILGHEMRVQMYKNFSQSSFSAMVQYLDKDLWTSDNSSSPLSLGNILTGFVANQVIPNGCTDACCGLPTMKVSAAIPVPADKQLAKAMTGTVCRLRTKSDVSILQEYLVLGQVMTVWSLLPQLTPTFGVEIVTHSRRLGAASWEQIDQANMLALQRCQDFCGLDPNCKAYMVGMNITSNSPTVLAPTLNCVFFSQGYPSLVYMLDRSQKPFVGGVLPSKDADAIFQAVLLFDGGRTTYSSRIMDGTKGVYTADDGWYAQYMVGGPYPNAAMTLANCEALCVVMAQCTAIAFPGCYLLNLAKAHSQTPSTQTAVYVKRFTRATVESVAGYAGVSTFADGPQANLAYLNQPAACSVASNGDVVFADVWNQRIRKITAYNKDCTTSGSSDEPDIRAYVSAIGNVSIACTSASTMRDLYQRMQHEVVELSQTNIVSNEFCKFAATPNATWLKDYTQNVMVLCSVCGDLFLPDHRPDICPPSSMCLCRDAIVEVMMLRVYRLCEPRYRQMDRWHKFISSYITCFIDDAPSAVWLTNSTKRSSLEARLTAYPVTQQR